MRIRKNKGVEYNNCFLAYINFNYKDNLRHVINELKRLVLKPIKPACHKQYNLENILVKSNYE